MNFFQSQANAKRRTGWLVFLFALAVVCLIGLTQLLVMLALGVLLLPIVNNRAMIQAREAAQQRAETLANHTSSV